MKVRKVLPLTLLLASTCAAAAVGAVDSAATKKIEIADPKDAVKKDKISAMNEAIQDALVERKVDATGTAQSRATQPAAEPYYGTKDAPVDGLDGKPHAGPFVDLSPDVTSSVKGAAAASKTAKAVPTGLDKLKDAIPNIPEKNDGVMDDVGRPIPVPGTTGTEGGVSEKEKAKSKQGPLVENTPPTPKEAPPLPHSEQERMKEQKGKDVPKTTKEEEVVLKPGEKSPAKPVAGGMGIEKPEDLPAKPHDLPHPDPKDPAGSGESIKTSYSGKGHLVETLPYTEGEKPKPKKVPTKVGSLDQDDQHSFEEWFHSFVVSLTMIIFTEIGDKTFLVAALMAMRHDRLVVFSAAFSALIAMTVLSAVLGHLAPTLLPKRLTTFAAALLFVFFGAKMLREGLAMSKTAGVGEEMKEVEAELEEKEHDLAARASRKDGLHILESGRKEDDAPKKSTSALSGITNLASLVFSPAWVSTFIMTFLGEWGDRSQIATIAMAAGQDYWWVTLGAILGHACCTGIAVIGGRALAGRVSMRVVTIGGAIAFLFFGVLYIVEAYTEA